MCLIFPCSMQGGDPVLMELLLLWGADVDAADAFQRTPLMYCMLFDKPEAAKLLIKRGAALGLTDCNSRTASQLFKGPLCTADADLVIMLERRTSRDGI